MLTTALNAVPKADRLDVAKLASALETTKVDWPIGELSMRAADHQIQLPLVISQVSKDARDKVDGTNMGFKPVMVLSSKDTETAVDPTCKMDRHSK
jgi:branched-chain amino acid transport system substrate-binding protein